MPAADVFELINCYFLLIIMFTEIRGPQATPHPQGIAKMRLRTSSKLSPTKSGICVARSQMLPGMTASTFATMRDKRKRQSGQAEPCLAPWMLPQHLPTPVDIQSSILEAIDAPPAAPPEHIDPENSVIRFDHGMFCLRRLCWILPKGHSAATLNRIPLKWRPGLICAAETTAAIHLKHIEYGVARRLMVYGVTEQCEGIATFMQAQLMQRQIGQEHAVLARWFWLLFALGRQAISGSSVRMEATPDSMVLVFVKLWNTHVSRGICCNIVHVSDNMCAAPMGIELASPGAPGIATVIRMKDHSTERERRDFEVQCEAEIGRFVALCAFAAAATYGDRG